MSRMRIKDLMAFMKNGGKHSVSARAVIRKGQTSSDDDESLSSTSATSSGRSTQPSEHLQKILSELIETEKSYIVAVEQLIDEYLVPLRSFYSSLVLDEMIAVLEKMTTAQRSLYAHLSNSIRASDFSGFTETWHFHSILRQICLAFNAHNSKFPAYSTFSLLHPKLLKMISSNELESYVTGLNHQSEQSSSMQSLLIKPVQRLVKYPSFFGELLNYAHPHSRDMLTQTKRLLEHVVESVNELQRIDEEFSDMFEYVTQFSKVKGLDVPDLSLSSLHMYGYVEWSEANQIAGMKLKRNRKIVSNCFIFRSGLLMLCREVAKEAKCYSDAILRYHAFIPTARLEVRIPKLVSGANAAPGAESRHEFWQVVDTACVNSVFNLANSSFENKLEFIKTARQVIRQEAAIMNAALPPKPRKKQADKKPTAQRALTNRIQPIKINHAAAASQTSIEAATTDSPSSPIWKPRDFHYV